MCSWSTPTARRGSAQIHPMQALRAVPGEDGHPRQADCGRYDLQRRSRLPIPDDAGALDVVGFDTAVPSVMADFVRT